MGSPWKFFAVSLALSAVVASAETTKTDKEIFFEKEKIILNGKTITVELAETDEQHERGLMYRKSLPQDQGMLFVFQDEAIRRFWMKNTYIDLSIGYFNKDKKLIDIQEMSATSVMETSPRTYPSAKPAMFALEMNKGWFKKNKVKIGHKFRYAPR